MLDIIVTDGHCHQKVMDVLGKGSVIGQDYMIANEMWHYEAVVSSPQSVKILTINYSMIKCLAQLDPQLDLSIK